MNTLENVTTGQTFTNGTSLVRFELLNKETLLVKNLETGKETSKTDDTHVYDVKDAKIDNGLTELETKVLKAIQYGDHYEEMPTVNFKEIVSYSGLKRNQVKGVLGSLEKKDLLMEGEYPDGETCYHLPKDTEAMLN